MVLVALNSEWLIMRKSPMDSQIGRKAANAIQSINIGGYPLGWGQKGRGFIINCRTLQTFGEHRPFEGMTSNSLKVPEHVNIDG